MNAPTGLVKDRVLFNYDSVDLMYTATDAQGRHWLVSCIGENAHGNVYLLGRVEADKLTQILAGTRDLEEAWTNATEVYEMQSVWSKQGEKQTFKERSPGSLKAAELPSPGIRL